MIDDDDDDYDVCDQEWIRNSFTLKRIKKIKKLKKLKNYD
jgi:hypothetical protein